MDDFATDNMIGTLVDTDSISSVPITAFVERYDAICLKSVADEHFDRMGIDVKRHYYH